jgi:putative transposase
MVQFEQSKQEEVISDMTFLPCLVRNVQENQLVTVALAPRVKKQTCKTKLNLLKKSASQTQSSQISEAGLTSSEKDLLPYWTQYCLEKSQQFTLATKTGCVGSDLNLFNEYAVNSIQNSWFSKTIAHRQNKNLPEISLQSFMFSPAEFTDSEDMLVRSRKIRIYPKKESLTKLNRYKGLSRYWYNKAIAYLKQSDVKKDIKALRDLQKFEVNSWALDCPQRIREHALQDALQSHINACKKFKKTKEPSTLHFRRKHDTKQGFGLDLVSLHDDSLFCGRKNFKLLYRATEKLEQENNLEGVRIICERGRYFVTIPRQIHIKLPDNQRCGMVSLDPGIRTFISLYNPSVFGKIGEGDFNHISRLCVSLDKIQSLKTKVLAAKRSKLRKAEQRIRCRIHDLISDLHNKTANFLVKHFDTIVLPNFNTSEMVSKIGRKIRSKTARSMMTFAFYRFSQILEAKCEEYSCKLLRISEAYTSKTCSYCGKIHKIGSSKFMKCCVKTDRDLNGARGIFLRAIQAFGIEDNEIFGKFLMNNNLS